MSVKKRLYQGFFGKLSLLKQRMIVFSINFPLDWALIRDGGLYQTHRLRVGANTGTSEKYEWAINRNFTVFGSKILYILMSKGTKVQNRPKLSHKIAKSYFFYAILVEYEVKNSWSWYKNIKNVL